jgi:hypothetical protein
VAYTWDFLHDLAREQVDTLPFEGALAFMELMAAAELDPWGVARADPDGPNMPNVVFGPNGEGQVALLILDGPHKVWITQVTWAS